MNFDCNIVVSSQLSSPITTHRLVTERDSSLYNRNDLQDDKRIELKSKPRKKNNILSST